MIYTLTLNPAVDREYTVSSLEFDSVLRANETRLDFGGKGFKVSRLLNSMMTASMAVGFLGRNNGRLLEAGLKSLGIQSDFIWIDGETRTNISIVTGTHDRYIKVNEKGPPVEKDKQHELLEKISSLAKHGDWWILAGSLPPGIEDDFYARVINCTNDHEARVILDTSGEALRCGCAAKPYLVKPSLEEAGMLTGRRLTNTIEAASAAAMIYDLGAQNVVISMGKAGAILHNHKCTWLAHSPNAEERNPIGAGDSLVGGLVWALTKGFNSREALGWGVACGAATASLDRTEVGSRALIEELYSQVGYERIEII
jgi:1-phosphofructokinase family hexose kinase